MSYNDSESGSGVTTNRSTVDKASLSSPDNLVNNWNHQKDILQHLVKKTREIFMNSDKVNEFPQCTWFEEDDLLFEDTMSECSVNITDKHVVGDIQKLEKTISESCTELNEIVARLISLSEG